MEHWGIYLAFGWLATIVLAFTDAVQAIRKGPQACPPRAASPPSIGNGSSSGEVLPSDRFSPKRRRDIFHQAGVWLNIVMRWPR
jgi:hypothetical protein